MPPQRNGGLMFLRILMGMCSCVLCLAPPAGECLRAGPYLRRAVMAPAKETPEVAKRETQAETRPAKVRLNELVFLPERFSHRGKAEFTRPRLKPLMDSIVSEGLQ